MDVAEADISSLSADGGASRDWEVSALAFPYFAARWDEGFGLSECWRGDEDAGEESGSEGDRFMLM
jgi:hypothetical protein